MTERSRGNYSIKVTVLQISYSIGSKHRVG